MLTFTNETLIIFIVFALWYIPAGLDIHMDVEISFSCNISNESRRRRYIVHTYLSTNLFLNSRMQIIVRKWPVVAAIAKFVPFTIRLKSNFLNVSG